MSRRLLHLELTGLVAVHAARAAQTALGAVPGLLSATVTLGGADVEHTGDYDADQFADAVRAALGPVGLGLRNVTVVQDRMLPLA